MQFVFHYFQIFDGLIAHSVKWGVALVVQGNNYLDLPMCQK